MADYISPDFQSWPMDYQGCKIGLGPQGLGQAPPPSKDVASPSNWNGNRSFLHGCLGHHAGIIAFAKLLVMICEWLRYPDTGILKVSFWSFLSNTKNGANFNLPTPCGRTTIHEKLSASGRGERVKHPPDKGLCRWIMLGYPPLSSQL